jgi:arsenate reductase (glutaredoxin)
MSKNGNGKKLDVVVLSYAGCTTCKKALAWLEARGVTYRVRPIVDEPPTVKELREWVPASELPVRKWLNTSGLSFRALGKEKIDAASDEELVKWLAADGKLVKRPVLVVGPGGGAPGRSAPGRGENGELRVLVGFKPEVWSETV